jgi:hypothetical protein
MRSLLRTVAPVLTFSVLTLAACSTTSGNLNTSSGASVSATAVGAAQESGRTLTQAQLLNAGLQASQWPKDIMRLLGGSGSVWKASPPPTSQGPQVPSACQPLVELLWGTSGSNAAASVIFQRFNHAIIGVMHLASYPHGRASALFASVRRAVGACPGFTELSQYVSFREKFVPLQGPHLGDESISFGAMRDVNGAEFLDRYDYVRVGAATVLIRQIGVTAAVPRGVPTLLAPQVAKLEAAQS